MHKIYAGRRTEIGEKRANNEKDSKTTTKSMTTSQGTSG
jgi:hypothetical protein